MDASRSIPGMIDQVQNRLPANILYKYLKDFACDLCSHLRAHDGKLESTRPGGDRRYLADGDGHMEPGYVVPSPGAASFDRRATAKPLKSIVASRPSVGCAARPCCSQPALVDADLRPAVSLTNWERVFIPTVDTLPRS